MGLADKLALIRKWATPRTRRLNTTAPRSTIRFRFGLTPSTIVGRQHAEAVLLQPSGGTVARNDQAGAKHEPIAVPARLVIRATGYAAVPVPGVPFDPATGRILHREGRIEDPNGSRTGMYCAGWSRRGASGGLGANKADAADTVHNILDDHTRGKLEVLVGNRHDLERILAHQANVVTYEGWRRIDAYELADRGAGTPIRRKLFDLTELLDAAQQPQTP